MGKQKQQQISAAERERRRRFTGSVIGSAALEGLEPDVEMQKEMARVDDGITTIEDLLDYVRKKHAQKT